MKTKDLDVFGNRFSLPFRRDKLAREMSRKNRFL
jgi:hypothetical protein